jgi:eukaryotic-like serine/threonine-protein kinase
MFEKLGRFEIKGLLGRGAMGEVYLGIDPSIGREVAIKTILATTPQSEETKERFSREAKAAGVLNHPNIVTIYEFGEDQGVLYIAMERVKGQDLEELLKQRSITPGEVLEVLAQVCDGLDYAHQNHIIHRDIKPSNVRVLRDGRRLQAKVMDFGVARLKDSEMTATGTVVGTVSYMAPEYIRTGKPDERSDLFAVGVMLYECISGRKPFEGDTTPTILYKIVNEAPDPVDVSQLREISPAIRSVMDMALAKEPDQRFQKAEDLANALRAARNPTWEGHAPAATVQIPTRTGTVPPPIERSPAPPTAVSRLPIAPAPKPRRSPLLPLLLGLAGLVVIGAGSYALYRFLGHSEPPIVPPAASVADTPVPQPQPEPAIPQPPEPPSAAPPEVVIAPVPAPGTVKQPASRPAKTASPLPPQPVVPQPPVDPNAMVPEPPPVEVPPKGNPSLGEAVSLADTNPGRAIEELKALVAADPGNASAYAWLVALLYEQGRYREVKPVLMQARQNGIPRPRLMANARFRMAMQRERAAHQLPPGVDE